MAIMDESHHALGVSTPNDTKQPTIEKGHTQMASNIDFTDEKGATPGSLERASDSEGHEKEKPSENAQNGVKKMEAVTLAWSKKSLVGVLILYVLASLRLTFYITDIILPIASGSSPWSTISRPPLLAT